jgi:hypothetical protein
MRASPAWRLPVPANSNLTGIIAQIPCYDENRQLCNARCWIKRVNLHMLQRHLLTTILLAPLVAALMFAQPVAANGAGFLSGTVFVDANGNALAEPQEATVPGATVYVRSQAASAPAVTVQTDANGHFVLSDVPYGTYEVWASMGDQAGGLAGALLLTVEVAEVNAQVLLNVPISAHTLSPGLAPPGALFLPLVTSAQ